MMGLVPVEVEVRAWEKMLAAGVHVPPAVRDVAGCIMVPPPVGERLWGVSLTVTATFVMMGLWGVVETGSVAMLMVPALSGMLLVALASTAVQPGGFMGVVLVNWPDTDNDGKRMPSRSKRRATAEPVLRKK